MGDSNPRRPEALPPCKEGPINLSGNPPFCPVGWCLQGTQRGFFIDISNNTPIISPKTGKSTRKGVNYQNLLKFIQIFVDLRPVEDIMGHNDIFLKGMIMTKSEGTKEQKPKTRSPNFPAVSLKKAVDLTGQLYDEYKKHEARINLVHKLWGYKEHGSAASRAIAAVNAFGLIEVSGVGIAKKVRVSDYGERVYEGAPDHEKILKKAALLPPIHLKLWTHFNGDIPNDELLRDYLLWEHKPQFNKLSVSSFISEFRETISFAKLGSSEIIEEEEAETKPPVTETKREPKTVQRDDRCFDLPLPLINGEMTVIKMPRLMMSEENYKFMLDIFEAYKWNIVRKPEQEEEQPEA